ncbi:MAG TPA: NUDIX domain-containing protein [Aggregatilineales bacterium]|nr:NUDIX domain-containing protein [Aggregatilineales bacterium]
MAAKDQGADATHGHWTVIPRTLCFVTHGGDVLLLKRAAHKRIFPNKYNGLGGHIERDEDPRSSAIREIKEEAGLDVINVRYRGVINIDAGGTGGIMLLVYTAEATSREVIDSEEGTLEWVALDEVPAQDVVEDLPILLPRLFGKINAPFSAHVSYDENDQLIFRFAE